MSIVNKAMVVNLQIGLWRGYRLDREATAKITEASHAAKDAARVNKHLVPKTALKEVNSAANALRQHFYDATLPWRDNGDRLLTREMYFDFMLEHGRLKRIFEDKIGTFVDETYPAARESAAFRMGDMFNPDDYPAGSEIRHSFYSHLEIDAVTTAGDFRVELDEESDERVRKEMEKAVNDRIERAMGNVWERLHETIGNFAERMEGDKTFRKSTVEALDKIVEQLPKLNVTGDARVTELIEDIRGKLTGLDPKTLREDTTERENARADAAGILDKMRAMQTAFGGE